MLKKIALVMLLALPMGVFAQNLKFGHINAQEIITVMPEFTKAQNDIQTLEKVGAHCRNHNTHSIGICYEGGLDANGKPKDTRTLNQQGSLLALLRELRRQFPKALIVGHHDLNPMKECPCFDCVAEYREL